MCVRKPPFIFFISTIMDTIIQQEYNDGGEDPNDILLWFQRHGPPHGVTKEYQVLSGAKVLMKHAMQRAATEVWLQFDPKRYAREKAEWEREMSAPYGVLRRMFWGRFRRYWNPSKRSGEIWLYHQDQKKCRLFARKAQYCEDRRRGAEKRRIREQEQIDRLGVDGFNRRMARQKQESIQNKAAKIDRSSKAFLRFLDWRQSPAGQKYDTPRKYVRPEKVFETPTRTSTSIVSVPMRQSSDLHEVLCRLVAEKKPVRGVEVTLMQTAAIETVPVPYVLVVDGVNRLNGMNRLPDFATRRLTSHAERDGTHYFGWGEEVTPYQQFPDEWRKYEGMESPLGNPRKTARGEIVRTLAGCIVTMTVTTQDHTLRFKTGADQTALTGDQVLGRYFLDPFEQERQKTLAAQREKAIQYQLRNQVPVAN